MEQVFGVLFSLYRGQSGYEEWIVGCLAGAWPKLLGDRLATVCRPVAYRKSELVIQILDNGWESTLRSVKPDLLKKLRDTTAGSIQSLSFRR